MEAFGYERIRLIGKGAFGAAYLVRGKDGGYCVAKEINLDRMKKEEKESAMKEIQVISALKHENIVRYITHFEVKSLLYIVMEYADSGDLEGRIKQQNGKFMSEEAILDYFIQITMALAYIHEKRILHRDLKSQNIFLTSLGIVKVGDFGISTVLRHTSELAGTMCGTPYYFSPELCQNKAYNNKSDIWSLGCILYELSTLKHAFDGANMKGLMQKILQGKYPPIPMCYSNELRALLDSMLQRNPAMRPSAKNILRSEFIQEKTRQMMLRFASRGVPPSAATPVPVPRTLPVEHLKILPTSAPIAQFVQHSPAQAINKPKAPPQPTPKPPGLVVTPKQTEKPREEVKIGVGKGLDGREMQLECKKHDLQKRQELQYGQARESAKQLEKERQERQLKELDERRKKEEALRKERETKARLQREQEREKNEILQRKVPDAFNRHEAKAGFSPRIPVEDNKKTVANTDERKAVYLDARAQREKNKQRVIAELAAEGAVNTAGRGPRVSPPPQIKPGAAEMKALQKKIDEEYRKPLAEAWKEHVIEREKSKKKILDELRTPGGQSPRDLRELSPRDLSPRGQQPPIDLNRRRELDVWLENLREKMDTLEHTIDDDDFSEDLDDKCDALDQVQWSPNHGKALNVPGVSSGDPLMHRIEVLRVFIEGNLGIDKFIAAYNAMSDLQATDDEDAHAEHLRRVVGADNEKFIPLINHLLLCEDEFNKKSN